MRLKRRENLSDVARVPQPTEPLKGTERCFNRVPVRMRQNRHAVALLTTRPSDLPKFKGSENQVPENQKRLLWGASEWIGRNYLFLFRLL